MEEIRLFELENEGWPPEPPAESPPVIIPGQSVYHIIFLGFLGVCYYRLGPFDPAFTIHEASSNTPGWFQAGEFWRPITAMTMHADLEHLMWNLLSLALLVPIVGREIGAGAAWFLAFAAGGLANIINVYFQDADFSSVGASGAALAALGILVGLRFSTHILQSGMPARWWRPVAAGLALLGLFSHSPRVDMIGHFLGFALGILFGIGARMIPARLAQSKIQDVLAVATMLLLLGSWVWLFRAVG
jgi:membrane associated rhomboid family serine protease